MSRLTVEALLALLQLILSAVQFIFNIYVSFRTYSRGHRVRDDEVNDNSSMASGSARSTQSSISRGPKAESHLSPQPNHNVLSSQYTRSASEEGKSTGL
ncbi:hypothetical protein F5Y14DRAFT_407164 [Nemania sp. NC0429]|nr:hypothetical protein F5Y14DRAFT_407164 [Nemania sp. NC0429]